MPDHLGLPSQGKRPFDDHSGSPDSPHNPRPGPGAPALSMDPSRAKQPRLERPSDNFSNAVKSKLQSYTRTGQACDRCKVRKIRCDALPEGCSHCLAQKLQCFVTDRISGRTERRGFLQELEREKADMLAHIHNLQTLLRDRGVDVQPWHWSPFSGTDRDPDDPDADPDADADTWSSLGSVRYRQLPVRIDTGSSSSTGSSTNISSTGSGSTSTSTGNGTGTGVFTSPSLTPSKVATPTSFPPPPGAPPPYAASYYTRASDLPARPIDVFVNIYGDSSVPSHAAADASFASSFHRSLLGTVLDTSAGPAATDPGLANLDSGAPAGLYDRSFASFMRSLYNINPPLKSIELPSRSDAFEYSEWYFLTFNRFVPILHKPTYMRLLERIYSDGHGHGHGHGHAPPSTAELVIVHMVFANIYFQYGVRNQDNPERQTQLYGLANKHYHWSLSKMCHLIADWSINSVIALLMLTAYVRFFSESGCVLILCNIAFTRAIDLGLHRSRPSGRPHGHAQGSSGSSGSSAQDTSSSHTNLDTEMRRRAFWVCLMLCSFIYCRLGRPMPMAVDDIDTELPLAIQDEYLTEDGITDPSRINQFDFPHTLHRMRYTPLFIDMYTHLYGPHLHPRRYEGLMHTLEQKAADVEAACSAELLAGTDKLTDQIQALFAQTTSLEFRLALHHPSPCTANNPALRDKNTRICEAAGRQMLHVVQRLMALKSHDTNWRQMSVFCVALFGSLAGLWERRFHTTPAELAVLRSEVSAWLSILAEVGLVDGFVTPHEPFNKKLTQICAQTVAWIQHDMPTEGGGGGVWLSVDVVARQLEDEARRMLQARQSFPASQAQPEQGKSAQSRPLQSQPQPQPQPQQLQSQPLHLQPLQPIQDGLASGYMAATPEYHMGMASGGAYDQAGFSEMQSMASSMNLGSMAAGMTTGSAPYMYASHAEAAPPSNPLVSYAVQATQATQVAQVAQVTVAQATQATQAAQMAGQVGQAGFMLSSAAVSNPPPPNNASVGVDVDFGLLLNQQQPQPQPQPMPLSGVSSAPASAQHNVTAEPAASVAVAAPHSAQWPLILFANPTSGVQ